VSVSETPIYHNADSRQNWTFKTQLSRTLYFYVPIKIQMLLFFAINDDINIVLANLQFDSCEKRIWNS